MLVWLVLIPVLPLSAAIVTAVLGPRVLKSASHLPVIVALGLSSLCSFVLVAKVHQGQESAAAAEETATGHRDGVFEFPVRLWSWALIEDAYVPEFSRTSAGGQRLGEPLPRPFRVDVTLRADSLTATMLAMVTFISTLVAVFSVGYMHGDRGYWRFFTYLALFVFSMAMLVSVSNFLLLFVFWEGVGVCSYLLIGFWYTKPSAVAAGKKAFLVNRIGDFGLILAVFLIWATYGTLNYHDVLHTPEGGVEVEPDKVQQQTASTQSGQNAGIFIPGVLGQSRVATGDFVNGRDGEIAILAICLLLLLGACGKSAQFPLHVWLPDAMEGPTPVSALIHAATMVTAGVYLVVRCTPLFGACPTAQMVVACVGGFTALLAALIALTQFDLKRVLAYSTISQLGYMFLALGTGTLAGITAGFFHLFTHAFFKALLFLGSGSVMHAMGNVIDMRRFGGLRHVLPKTHLAFLCGCIALAGIPPLSGFWSKDQIVKAVKEKADNLVAPVSNTTTASASTAQASRQVLAIPNMLSARIYRWLQWSAMFTAFLTAFYTFRAYYLTFWGPQRVPDEAEHPHEAPPSMLLPLAVLSVCAVVVGGLFEWLHLLGPFLLHTPSLSGPPVASGVDWPVALISSGIAVAGVAVASGLYLGDVRWSSWLRSAFELRWISRVTGVQPDADSRHWRWAAMARDSVRWKRPVILGWLLGQLLWLLCLLLMSPVWLAVYLSPYRLSREKLYLDELYTWFVVSPLRTVASISATVDRWVIDGLVNLLGWLPRVAGSMLRLLQRGLLQFYALSMVLGTLLLLVVWIFWLR
ncbi:MAG: NADH-quinone oxidoreductase subunit L [Planctomycetaceae bacterium]|nr:NADH-quinone oxidoreductase subunit L [Planctomycetaceae bacterium]